MIAASTVSTTEPKTKLSVPIFMPRNFIKWEELIRGFLMRHAMAHLALKMDRPADPTADEVKQTLVRKNGKLTETKKTRLLFENSRKSKRFYEKRNMIAYSYILESVSDPTNEIAYRVVSDYAKEQEDACLPVTAKGALQKLRERFHVVNQRVLQAELASFNSMNILPNEKAESFVNRLLDSKATLANLGRKLDDDTDLLGRLIAGLKASERYAAVGHLMGLTSDLTWRKAVDQIVAGDYDTAFQKLEEEMKTPQNSTAEKANLAKDSRNNGHRDDRDKNDRDRFRERDRKDRDKWCSLHHTSSHDERECKSLNRDRSKLTCHFCDKEGHTVDRCIEKKRYIERKKRRQETDIDDRRMQRKREMDKPDSDDSSFGG